MEVADHLHITWATGSEFLEVYEALGPGRYTVRSPQRGTLPAEVDAGRMVIVELDFRDTDRRFRHSATVVERLRGDRESVTLEFLDEEREIRDLILCSAEGERVPYLNRRAPRFPVWMPVAILVGDLWRRGVASELAELGAFVGLDDPPASGTQVVVRFSTISDQRVEIAANVIYTRSIPGTGPGCGLEFAFSSRREEKRVRRLIRSLLEQGRS